MKTRQSVALILAGLATMAGPALAAPGAPGGGTPGGAKVEAFDTPNDDGRSITVRWTEPSDANVTGSELFVASAAGGPWESFAKAARGDTERPYRKAEPGAARWFKIASITASGSSDLAEPIGPVMSSAQWFNMDKLKIFILGAIICLFIIYFIGQARRGKALFVRKIAGLEAVDEAIGRATEMGRPVLFIPGIMDLDNVQTLAGLTMLGYVTKRIAEYDSKLDVPVSRSLVMTAAREVVEQAYLEAARPDAYNEDMVHYLTDEQFGYVAGVNGIIMRDEPATCVYMGAFYAESLILAETGNNIGAIQIAGTAMPAQLPFFVAACDYTLIGEELFAASAYLSGDPKQLGSLKGQDMGKLIVMVAIAIGSTLATLAGITGSETLASAHHWIAGLFG